jgi:DNA-binding NarL/FixJ family response regulator
MVGGTKFLPTERYEGEPLLYDTHMPRVFLADSSSTERFALRLYLMDLKMEVIGEAADWSATLAQLPLCQTDLLLVDWNLLPNPANVTLEKLRATCPAQRVIVLIGHSSDRLESALASAGYTFIIKDESYDRLVERLSAAAAGLAPD